MKLVLLRKNANLSQKELAKLISAKQSTVSKWEQGKSRPKIETIKKLAEVLQVSVEKIVECF